MAKKTPLDYGKLACDAFMHKYLPAALPPAGTLFYHQGVLLAGMQNVYLLSGEKRYFDYIKAYVDSVIGPNGALFGFQHELNTEQTPELAKMALTMLDHKQPSILFYNLYDETGDEKYLRVIKTIGESMYFWPVNQYGGYWHMMTQHHQMWLDGAYMAGPLSVMYADRFGGEVLRDVPFETFLAKLPECRKQCGDRAVLRAFHFYADNDRVPQQVAALREGDFDAFLQMVTASGDSSWEYLQNVIPAGYKEHQEVAVTIAAAKHYLGGKGAVRVHGGGFAGTVQAFVPVEMLADFKANMEKILGAGRCHVLSIRPEGGAVL